MPRMNGSFVQLYADGRDGYVKKVNATARKLHYEAVALFLREVQKHVPTYTGMARGSLLPLAGYLNAKGVQNRVAINITPKRDRRARYLIDKGQNVSAGEKRSDFEFVDDNGKFKFAFNAGVEHYKFNDVQQSSIPLTNPTPWLSFQKGIAKANDYLARHAKDIPRIKFTAFKATIGRSRRTF
jgi:hypothetical protein